FGLFAPVIVKKNKTFNIIQKEVTTVCNFYRQHEDTIIVTDYSFNSGGYSYQESYGENIGLVYSYTSEPPFGWSYTYNKTELVGLQKNGITYGRISNFDSDKSSKNIYLYPN